ncbi:hypothetical protein F2Q69_00055936 [Brassica cretica]|uniref:C2H2-type domain-containing protein n=1 Tax=Brassica cretica TaxID=69181 RepID=A0A8S9N0V3_BRACR|nr:hypothetical protein F2Q69_00055936 [Brassica cretica]
MSQSLLHVCKTCGKWFATAKAVYGHQRVHSELKRKPRVRVFCSVSTSIESKALDPSLSLKESSSYSFMSEIEKQEMDEAAMSLVMLSQGVSHIRNWPPGIDQPKQEFFSEVSATCSDVVVAQALPSPFGCFQSLGGHQNLHRGGKRKRFEDGSSPSASSEAKKIVPQPSKSFEVSQEEHSVELKEGFEKLSTCSDVLAQPSSSPRRCNMQKGLQSKSSYERGLKML